ncbi:DUF5667 domain-containing protein [Candidatus Parcubacteria bacterium]|nr:DUF5667 domain-containing protein [Candidatus Parcubacteria bacterium]
MNEFFTQLATEGKKNQLSASEKSAMLARLQAEMKAKPIRPQAGNPAVRVVSPYAFLLSRSILVPFLFMLLVVGSASAYAAEGAVPGDLLYPVKVGLTEPVRATLAFTAEAKASWHAEAAGRRMREAETLALRGELSATKSAEIAADFDRHISMVETFLGAVESNSPLKAAEISARFASSLASYGSDLLRAGFESVDIASRRQTDSLAEHVKIREVTLVSPERAKAAAPARTKFKPSSSLPTSPTEATTPVQVTFSANAAPATLVSLRDVEKEVLASLARIELQYSDLRPWLGTEASREVELRAADIRELLAEAAVADEKKKAAALERVRLAQKHAAALEAFLKEHKKDSSASSDVQTAPVIVVPGLPTPNSNLFGI